jgi:hypothetical protein
VIIYLLTGVVVLVVLLVLIIALRPAEFTYVRSAKISVPPEKLFPHVNDLHQWQAWSPWAKLDPNSKSTFSGPDAGAGAAMAWAGNNKVGEGKMTIIESRPNDRIRIRLEFLKPMQATHMAEFTFKPDGNQTHLTWAMSGRNNFMGKAFGLFVNCDKMIGGQFEQGLASLNAVVR